MSFRKDSMKPVLPLLLLSALMLCIGIIALSITNDLTKYIHPRYVLFTVTLVSFGFIVLLYDLIVQKPVKDSIKLSMVLTLVFCGMALILPPQTLSSRAALTRQQSSYQLGDVSKTSYDEFSTDYTSFTISEWTSLLSRNPPVEQIQDKKAIISGFAFREGDSVFIARFRISCCSVDATPLTIILDSEGTAELIESDWYEITGTFVLRNGEYILVPDNIQSIDAPENQYVF